MFLAWTLYRKPFEKAVKDEGLTDFRFHDIRHCFASDLVRKGVDLKTVSALLGHSTIKMTERYAHLSPAHKRAAIELLPRGLCYTGATLKPEKNKLSRNDMINEVAGRLAQWKSTALTRQGS